MREKEKKKTLTKTSDGETEEARDLLSCSWCDIKPEPSKRER